MQQNEQKKRLRPRSNAANDLVIPNVPFVANVGEDITLEIDFIANSSAVQGN